MAKGTCSVDGCDAICAARGLCNRHYLRLRIHGDVNREPYRNPAFCKIDDCGKPGGGGRGWCSMHYSRFLRHGDPLWTRAQRICEWENCETPAWGLGLCPLHYTRQRRGMPMDAPRRTRRYTSQVCAEPGCERKAQARGLCTMHYLPMRRTETGAMYRQGGYLRQWIDGTSVAVHRMIMEQLLDRPLLPFENVHHKNGIRDDNRPENLELWTVAQPCGQRPEDLAEWVVEHYRDLVIEAMNRPLP